MKLLSLARILRVGGIIAVIGALAGVAAPMAHRFGQEIVLKNVVASAAAHPGKLPVRIVAPQRAVLFAFGPPSRQAVALAVASTLEEAAVDRSPETQHAAGLASLLTSSFDDATRYLAAAAAGSDDARVWTNLAACQYMLAVRNGDDESLLASLGAASRALALDPKRVEALYDFALAVEHLGVTPAAAQLWKTYEDAEAGEAWKRDARHRREALSRQKSSAAEWKESIANGLAGPADLAHMTSLCPQQARGWAELDGLTAWAEAARVADPAAEIHLRRVRIIARTLAQQSGESLLDESVAAIDQALAAGNRTRIKTLIAGHILYARGRALYREKKLREAQMALDQAERSLAAGRSPMSALAAAYAASVLHDADRFNDAHRRLTELLTTENRRGIRHYALRAQIHYQIARADFIRGFWGDSLAASAEAEALYHRIGERGSEGMCASLTAESYDFIGQPALAMRHGLRAIRLIGEAGDFRRFRVSVANLCRASMRRGLWDTSDALIRIERALEVLGHDAVFTSDTAMRAAIIDDRLGRPAAAMQALQTATAAALRLSDDGLRNSMIADINATSGALARRYDPAKAVTLLGEAISYQERMDRAIMLPQLYLERGRAQLALHRPADALVDFELGIERLEGQRSRLHETNMRYGIFDDAHELFAEAMSLHLNRGQPEAAYAILERARGRALLEQIAGEPAAWCGGPHLADVRRAMPANTLMIEYAMLADRLVLFLAGGDFFDVREVRVDAATLAAKSAAFVDALVARRPENEVRAIAADLYALLIEPVRERARFERLVLVPDSELQQIPFAALFDDHRRQFLLQQHLLVTVPSAGVFLQGRARYGDSGTPPPKNALVVVGARGDASLALRRLPEAQREASVIASAYSHSLLLNESDASVDRFVDEASRHEVVHFAGHALLDTADPAQSALVLAGQTGEAALLRCRQIGGTRFRAPRVVVLAACSTMRGRAGRADGTPSIARSFLAAGVPSVVGTLWDVDDAETSALITRLHQNMARGLSPAAALRDAQLAALHDHYGVARHPGSWAAYALLGAGGL